MQIIGVQKKIPDNDGSFPIKCEERAIQIYPYLANALLLQVETYTKQFQKLMKELQQIFRLY